MLGQPQRHPAVALLGSTDRFVVYPGEERYPLKDGAEAIPMSESMTLLQDIPQ